MNWNESVLLLLTKKSRKNQFTLKSSFFFKKKKVNGKITDKNKYRCLKGKLIITIDHDKLIEREKKGCKYKWSRF